MKKLIHFSAFLLVCSALLWSCHKDETIPLPPVINTFSVSPDSIPGNGIVAIEFDFDRPIHMAYGIKWESDGGEFLYKNSPLMGFPAYWKAPETPGEYNLSVIIKSTAENLVNTVGDTVKVVVY
jgi:hypothetical protein